MKIKQLMQNIYCLLKDNWEDVKNLFLDERTIQKATSSCGIFGSDYGVITKSLGRKYDLVMANLIRSCVSKNGLTDISKYTDILVKQSGKETLIEVFGGSRVNFSEIKKEEVVNRMMSAGIIRENQNRGSIKNGVIGEDSDQYSLTQYAMVWLSIVDEQKMSNKFSERLKVVAIFVAIILAAITISWRVVASLFVPQIVINLFL